MIYVFYFFIALIMFTIVKEICSFIFYSLYKRYKHNKNQKLSLSRWEEKLKTKLLFSPNEFEYFFDKKDRRAGIQTKYKNYILRVHFRTKENYKFKVFVEDDEQFPIFWKQIVNDILIYQVKEVYHQHHVLEELE